MIRHVKCQKHYNKVDIIWERWRVSLEIAPDKLANLSETCLVSAVAIDPNVAVVDVD